MNKKELIKQIKKFFIFGEKDYIERNEVLKLVEQLDEPEKVKVPQYIADKIEYARKYDYTIFDAMMMTERDDDFYDWLYTDDNIEVFARAWLDGYDIQETKYVVTDGNHLYFKKYQEDIEIVILVDEQPGTMEYVKKFDTKEEAQKAADILGWKVQEVE